MRIGRFNINDGDKQIAEHFALHEFQSKNGCHEVLVSEDLLTVLEEIYIHFNCTSAIVVDGYREPGRYCYSIGGLDRDAHACGLAADMVFVGPNYMPVDNRLIACYAQDIGLGGIGYMGGTIHLDVRQLGGYKNTHWWGDETNGANVTDWYSYFGINRCHVYGDEQVEDIKESGADSVTKAEAIDYVNCDYIYYLGRMADTEGLSNYAGRLVSGEMSEGEVDSALANSYEAKVNDTKRYIRECYRTLQGREASGPEVEDWYNATSGSSTPLRDIYYGIRYSDECINRMGR